MQIYIHYHLGSAVTIIKGFLKCKLRNRDFESVREITLSYCSNTAALKTHKERERRQLKKSASRDNGSSQK